MTPSSPQSNGTAPRHVRVAILGAGFGGLGTAIRLKQRGEHDFLILERAADVGGTWWANTYPGCQCDIPSHLYSFSFAPNPDWTRTYPKQPELRDYLRATAENFGVSTASASTPRSPAPAGTRTPPLAPGDQRRATTPPTCWSRRPGR